MTVLAGLIMAVMQCGTPCLENDQVRVALSPDTGGITSILDKRHGYEYVEAPDRARLVRLMIPAEGEACRHLDGANPKITVKGDKARIEFRWEGVSATATLELDGDALNAELQIENGTGETSKRSCFRG